MSVVSRIKKKLTDGLKPVDLQVIDESHLHEGHTGAKPGGESHFRLNIVSQMFEGKNLLQRQRIVYELLKEEMAGPIHALQMTTRTPRDVSDGPQGKKIIDETIR